MSQCSKTCPHCRTEYRDVDAFHCPYCGQGIRPLPCNCREPVVEPQMFREEKEGIVYVVWVECPECHAKSHAWQRSKWAIDEWNRVIRGYWSEHFEPPKWIEPEISEKSSLPIVNEEGVCDPPVYQKITLDDPPK